MNKQIKLFPIQIIAIGFGLIIIVGGILLTLPICNKSGDSIPFINGLFTATSATCVTGLSVYDIYSQFNFLGQLILILLIQVGGLGFMGIAMTLSFALGSKISLFQRSILMESISTLHIGGVVKTIRRMLFGTLAIEGIGAIILSIRFTPKVGLEDGLWFGIFHSISAFCNAGFDLMGKISPGSSLTHYSDDYIVNFVICFLIASGGIGFIVWNDIIDHKFNIKKYALHSKIMLVFTVGLIFIGAIGFFLLEEDFAFKGMSTGDRAVASIFASVSPRTAGFNTVAMDTFSASGKFLTMLLMIIGAGPGSTGGGIKITNFVTIVLSIISYSKHYNDLSIFKRRLESDAQRRAFSSTASYLTLMLTCLFFLLVANPDLAFDSCLFEAISAIGTVGLTVGITPTLGAFSKFCLIILMYCGRLGSIAVAMAIVRRRIIPKISYPEEKIIIG